MFPDRLTALASAAHNAGARETSTTSAASTTTHTTPPSLWIVTPLKSSQRPAGSRYSFTTRAHCTDESVGLPIRTGQEHQPPTVLPHSCPYPTYLPQLHSSRMFRSTHLPALTTTDTNSTPTHLLH